jgi:hypothetical protein
MEKLSEVIRQVGRAEADLLLIAGDLFHRQPLKRELKEVNYLFSTIPDTKVILMAGTMIISKRIPFYQRFPWNPNVIVVGKRMRKSLPGGSGYLYLWAELLQPGDPGTVYDLIRPVRTEGCTNILLAHEETNTIFPSTGKLLKQQGLTMWLGAYPQTWKGSGAQGRICRGAGATGQK